MPDKLREIASQTGHPDGACEQAHAGFLLARGFASLIGPTYGFL